MDAIVDNGYVIIGSPDEVAEQLREVAVNLNVGHLMLLLQFGNMSKDLCRYNTKLFAEQVMPKLKDLFADWEDRWWPQPMAAGAARRGPGLPAEARRRITRVGAAVSEPETLTVDVNGFATRVWRKGSGPKLGFLAGFGGLPRWMPFLDELAKSRTVIVPSLPGFPGGDRGHTVLDTHLDWVLAVREIAGEGGAGRRRSGRQFGRRLAGRRDRGALAGDGAPAGADRAVRPVRRDEPADRSVGAARRRGARADVRRSGDLEGDEGDAGGRQLDRMADRADARQRGRRAHLLAARQYQA